MAPEGFKWRNQTALVLTQEAFAKLKLEQGDKFRVFEFNGHTYGALYSEDGYDLYVTAKRVMWAYRNRFTEGGAGGGTNTVKITPQANSSMKLRYLFLDMCNAAAGRTASVYVMDEDDNGAFNLGGAALDDQGISYPTIGTAAAANNTGNSLELEIAGDGSYLRVIGASLAQNEYFDIVCGWELFGTATPPTVAHSSTGTATTGTASQDEVTLIP